MLSLNHSNTTFLLMGLPGLEEMYIWISIPLCVMYIVAVAGNSLILWVVKSETILHQPMYYFLSMLAMTDLGLSFSTLPTMLTIYLLGNREVEVDACLAQLFFIHTFSVMESSVLLSMAFDRFVTICNPLRYTTILPNSRVAGLGLAIVVRSIGLHVPAPIMLKKLPYCHTGHLSHSYCLHPDVMKLACTDTHVNSAYGLFVVLSTLGMDSMLIVASYVLILYAVLTIASQTERLKALNTCVSHICAVLLFYTPMIGLSMIHRFGKQASPCIRVLLSYLHFLMPPMVNPIVYTIKTKQIRQRIFHFFQSSGARMRIRQEH
ncbi:olfactory receptor 51G2-like [Gracilinanus agilis]|uniref:olfactory receptor 51G2-like n=1 Tax=Gracilinanus agilis TaxID=191870 RepID=UPI001CFDA6E4|nr:olfactory receptor 51G2-like [Gracilinanus agilis]